MALRTTSKPAGHTSADDRTIPLPTESPSVQEMPIEEALGPLNKFEQHHAPKRLFLQGDLSLLRQVKVSIVGSRKPTEDGLKRATRLARELVRRDVVVVSGLALGIDVAAHRTAIAEGGRTIAVIGTPLDDVHPRAHRQLQEEIARHHLVVSQFASGHPVLPRNFPMRNRTMALIVDASVTAPAPTCETMPNRSLKPMEIRTKLPICPIR